MSRLFDRIDTKKARDIKVLRDFVAIYCREKHGGEERGTFVPDDARVRGALGEKELILCPECRKLLLHGISKLLLCPYDPKPMCKKCPDPCYAPGYRAQVRQIMRFSGSYLIKHGRLDMIIHYFL